ncbi:FtsX-like permease family protein, partial [uncultured Clostridium sp.]|uniref:FtsX-like permease family protein n=1 Tax=uncultured Clostridium sp. TaxID=59620 RepID=UPI0026018B51
MYLNLALKNLKNNMRDYLVYFFTIAVSISLFYAFGVLDKSHYLMQTMGIVADYELSQVNSGYNIASIGVGVILAIVIIYANTFFLKRRRKEIGVCLTLGMSKKSIAVVMFLEALGIGVISLIIGIILGVVISQLLAMATLSLVGIGLSKYKFIFSFGAVARTFIYFIIIFIIVGFYNITNVAN